LSDCHNKHVIVEGVVGDPFPLKVEERIRKLNDRSIFVHYFLRWRPTGKTPNISPTSSVTILSPAGKLLSLLFSFPAHSLSLIPSWPTEYRVREARYDGLRRQYPGNELILIDDDGSAAQAYRNMHKLQQSMAAAFELCEICFWPILPISIVPQTMVLSQLVDWVNHHFGMLLLFPCLMFPLVLHV
jgi:hypothetical protein